MLKFTRKRFALGLKITNQVPRDFVQKLDYSSLPLRVTYKILIILVVFEVLHTKAWDYFIILLSGKLSATIWRSHRKLIQSQVRPKTSRIRRRQWLVCREERGSIVIQGFISTRQKQSMTEMLFFILLNPRVTSQLTLTITIWAL